MKVFARILFALTLWGLVSCGGTKSAPHVMAEHRAYLYTAAYKAYIDAENKYLNLLFNIERLPEEEELWIMKREQMRELELLRTSMLQARGDLDESLQDWEKYLSELQKETAISTTRARFRNGNPNDERTSPGQLLPGEFLQDSIRKAQSQMRR